MSNNPKSWQCPGCNKWKAPHVEECECQQAANPFQPVDQPYMPAPALPPVQPWPPQEFRPWWEVPTNPPFIVTCTRLLDGTADVQVFN